MCNEKGIKLPWDEIAELLDPKATGGATVQHLAKLRVKLQEQGKSVPPPLRRPTAAAQQSFPNGDAGERKWVPAGTAASGSQERLRSQPQKRSYKEESDVEYDDEEDGEYHPHPAKRSALGKSGGTSKSRAGKNQGGEIGGTTGSSGAPWSSLATHIHEPESSSRNPKGKGRATSFGGRGRSEMDFMQPPPKDPVENIPRRKLPVVLKISPSFCSKKFPDGLSQWPSGVSGPSNYDRRDEPEESGPEAFPDTDEEMNDEEYHPVVGQIDDDAEHAGEDHTDVAAADAEGQYRQDGGEAALQTFGNSGTGIGHMDSSDPVNRNSSGIQTSQWQYYPDPMSTMSTMNTQTSDLTLTTPSGSTLPAFQPVMDFTEFESSYIDWGDDGGILGNGSRFDGLYE